MGAPQCSQTFYGELKLLGLEMPEDVVSFEIIAARYGKPVEFRFVYPYWLNMKTTVTQTLLNKGTGKELTSSEFYLLLKDVISFPDNVSSFRIKCELDKVVEMVCTSAFPADSLGCLSDYKLNTQA